MPLDKNTLKTQIAAAFHAVADTAAAGSGDIGNDVITKLSTDLAAAIDAYVKTGTVVVASVSGVTSGPAISGPGTGKIT